MKISSVLLVLQLAACSLAGLLRTPRVYNALVTSSENLTPSRAFPVLQPVLHETAIGYPLHGSSYTLSPINSFSDYGPYLPAHVELQPYNTRFDDRPKPADQKHEPVVEILHRDIPPLPPHEHGPPQHQDERQEQGKTPAHDQSGKPQGLPPSLIPIQQYQIHDTIPFGYTGVPHLYYPYQLHQNFSPYPVLPPEYYRPSSPQPPVRRRPAQPQPEKEKSAEREDGKLVQPLPDSRVPPPPDTGDNRNNSGKNPDVPDVPAPPPPVGKKSSSL